MLTTVKAYSSWKSAPVLPLSGRGPETDLLQVRDIEGLGPVKAAVNTTPYGSMDGEAFTGSLVNSRNIVLTIGLNPNWDEWSMEALRRLVYSYFMPKLQTKLVFESNDEFPPVEISGYVESVEPDIFAKDVQVQVSIICPDPYFVAVDPVVINDVSNAQHLIDYNGSIETGIYVRVSERDLPAPTLIGVQIDETAASYFRVAASVSSTKYLEMNSLPGNKYVQNVELGTGIITNLLPKMVEGSSWPTLQPGEQIFSVTSDAGSQDWELTYFERFGGL